MTTIHYPPNDTSLEDTLKAAEPGTTILCSASDLGGTSIWNVKGTADKPITIRGVGTSPVTLDPNGRCTFRECEYLIVENFQVVNDFWFQDCTGCQLVHCNFHCLPTDTAQYCVRVLGTKSSENMISSNRFRGKRCSFAYVHIRESIGDAIQENWFCDYEITEGDTNGQCIITGDSGNCMTESNCLITGNVFQRDIAERTEIISVKSCCVTMRDNFFINCRGAISLRLANDCEITGNQFYYEKDDPAFEPLWHDSGGVRVFGARHKITGNQFYGLAYGVYVMNGDYEELSAGQELYARAKDVIVLDNDIVQCAKGVEIGGSDSTNVQGELLPLRVTSQTNRYWCGENDRLIETSDCGIQTIWSSEINNGEPPEFDEDAADEIRQNAGVKVDES